MRSLDVSLVIVNYNAGGELAHALRSVAADLEGRQWEAIVVDNASTDGSPDAIGADARVRVIRNERNVGFARAVNQGVAASAAPLVLLLNPDCQVAQGTFEILARELAQTPACAIAGPRIVNPDGTPQGNARGDPDMLTGLFGRTSRLRKLLPGLATSTRNVVDDRVTQTETVDWLSGACVLIRRSVLTEVKGFDERYFLYWEDADLCRRIRALGYHVRYVPAATAVHRVGQSSRTARAASVRAFHESAYLYYAIHVAPHAAFKRLLARVLLTLRCQVQLLGARG